MAEGGNENTLLTRADFIKYFANTDYLNETLLVYKLEDEGGELEPNVIRNDAYSHAEHLMIDEVRTFLSGHHISGRWHLTVYSSYSPCNITKRGKRAKCADNLLRLVHDTTIVVLKIITPRLYYIDPNPRQDSHNYSKIRDCNEGVWKLSNNINITLGVFVGRNDWETFLTFIAVNGAEFATWLGLVTQPDREVRERRLRERLIKTIANEQRRQEAAELEQLMDNMQINR